MTNCSPASSRSRWCARIMRRPRAARRRRRPLAQEIIEALPYSLTPSQTRAVDDIVADLAKPERMLRLLQGDVGSGKTVVALLAAATVIEAGRQAALMAPTEILARQHFNTIAPLAAGRRHARRDPHRPRARARARADILDALGTGDIDLLVGTHALFQDEVAFRDLALAVVDEQHRFGVHQRLALARKGEAVDVLVMTATPIPRTLVLTYFGDMDVSELREKPAGRQPIDTRTVPLGRLQRSGRRGRPRARRGPARLLGLPAGRRIRESATSPPPRNASPTLKQRFGDAVDLVHGRMKGAEKDARHGALRRRRDAAPGRHHGDRGRRRRAGSDRDGDRARRALRPRAAPSAARPHRARARALDLPAALQARRSAKPPRRGSTILRETEDGFRIAEEDLRLRGEGDVLGTRQSGMPGFRVARIEVHGKLLEPARDDAQLILARDPTLDLRARGGAAPPALSVRARRGDPAAAGGVNSLRRAAVVAHGAARPVPFRRAPRVSSAGRHCRPAGSCRRTSSAWRRPRPGCRAR